MRTEAWISVLCVIFSVKTLHTFNRRNFKSTSWKLFGTFHHRMHFRFTSLYYTNLAFVLLKKENFLITFWYFLVAIRANRKPFVHSSNFNNELFVFNFYQKKKDDKELEWKIQWGLMGEHMHFILSTAFSRVKQDMFTLYK